MATISKTAMITSFYAMLMAYFHYILDSLAEFCFFFCILTILRILYFEQKKKIKISPRLIRIFPITQMIMKIYKQLGGKHNEASLIFQCLVDKLKIFSYL